MTNRARPCLLLTIGCIAVGGAACGASAASRAGNADAGVEAPAKQTAPKVEDILANPLDDEDYVKTSRCLYIGRFRRIEIVSDRILAFHGRGDRMWLNVLSNRCQGLRPDMMLSLDRDGRRICAGDRFRGLPRMSAEAATVLCVLGDFKPVKRDRVDALLDALAAQHRTRTVAETVGSTRPEAAERK